MIDSAGGHNLGPPALTDSEYESESDVESDETDDIEDLPDTLLDINYGISDEGRSSIIRHRSKCNPSERIQTKFHQPSGRYSFKDRIEVYGETDKECGKDAVETEETSYSTSVESSNLDKTVERTRCNHAETTKNGYMNKAEVEDASSEMVSLTPTVAKNESRIAKGPDISENR